MVCTISVCFAQVCRVENYLFFCLHCSLNSQNYVLNTVMCLIGKLRTYYRRCKWSITSRNIINYMFMICDLLYGEFVLLDKLYNGCVFGIYNSLTYVCGDTENICKKPFQFGNFITTTFSMSQINLK